MKVGQVREGRSRMGRCQGGESEGENQSGRCGVGSSDFDIFFINSICFMFLVWPWILRIVYKKNVSGNIEWFLSYLTLYPPKKVAPPLIRVEKKISSKLGIQGIKRSGILRWFKKCAEVSCLAKRKIILHTTVLNFWEKILGNFLTQEFYTVLKSAQNSASFDTLCAQFWRNFFFNSCKGRCCFFNHSIF